MLPWIFVLLLVSILQFQFIYFGAVLSGSMEPIFYKGDLVLMQTYDKSPVVGDIVMFGKTDLSAPVTHRVISVRENGRLVTKGDANKVEDLQDIDQKTIIGKVLLIKGKPIIIKSGGAVAKPEEAGEFKLASRVRSESIMSENFNRVRTLYPMILFFGTIFYFFILIDSRTESNRRFNNKGRNGFKNKH